MSTSIRRSLSTSEFQKLVEARIKVAAIVVIGKRGFDKRDKGLIAQALGQ